MQDDGRRLGGWQWLLLLTSAALVLGNNLGGFGSLTEHEIVVGGIARQMAEEGSWGRLMIGDRNWLEKPPLPHWLAALSVSLFGVGGGWPGSEWSVRLPSLLQGLGVVAITAVLGARWFGAAVGLAAGLLLTCSYSFFHYARLAENDMVLCLLVVGALACLARALEATPGSRGFRRWRLGFWILLGAANLSKGPFFGDLLVGAALAAWWLWQRDWRLPLRLLSPAGLVLALLLALAWPLWVWSQGELPVLLDWWFSEMGGRFDQGYYQEAKPPWYYLASLPWQLLPWSPLLLLAWPLAWRRQRAAPRPAFAADRFLLCWAFAPLLLLSLAPHRHHHYALATLPAQALLAAAALPALGRWLAARAGLARRLLPALLLAGAAALAAALVLLPARPTGAEPFLLPFGLPLLAGLPALAWTLRRGRVAAAGGLALAVFLALFWVFGSNLIPRNDPSAADTAFLRRVTAQVPPDARLALAGKQPVARLRFYVERPAPGFWDPRSLGDWVRPGETLYVVTRGDEAPALARLGRVTLLDRSPRARFGDAPGLLYGLYRLEVPDGASSTAPDGSTTRPTPVRLRPAQGPAMQ